MQKLLYCLHTAWLTKAELTKLDGFHARCLRKVLSIPHSYLSHVSNADVLVAAGVPPLSAVLRERQLLLFGAIARKPAASPGGASAVQANAAQPQRWAGARRRGRPRQAWATCVHEEALQAAGSQVALDALVVNEDMWRQTVHRYVYT